MASPLTLESLATRVDAIDERTARVDDKLDDISTLVVRIDERQGSMQSTLNAQTKAEQERQADEARRQRTDRAAMVTAVGGILVAVITTVGVLLGSGAL